MLVACLVFGAFVLVTALANHFNLNIKAKTVGDGQHGTARWATPHEIRKTYRHIPFTPELWREQARRGETPTVAGKRDMPLPQGVIVGCTGRRSTTAIVDCDDIHCLMTAASGTGKTAYFLYPNLEYACASGMSFLALDTKGDLARKYGAVAKNHYGYQVSVIDLRHPSRADGNNLLTLINRYMDMSIQDPDNLAARARAEKYAKILAKTIVNPSGSESYGQNAFFYDAAEGLLTAVILLTAEFCPPEQRHIVTVFKLTQELSVPASQKGKTRFQQLMDILPDDHKARWFAGAALGSASQSMASVISTVLSRLNSFLDSELEQVLCFDGSIDAEIFTSRRCGIFLIVPEEDSTKNFMASLMIQNLSRELFFLADEHGGRLPNRAIFFCDELGTMPAFDILPLFSAGRSRNLTLIPIIQTMSQLQKHYGKEGADIICDNCQVTIFGGFAPNSGMAESLSKNLGSKTVMSGSVSRGKHDPSESLQMIERPLMTADELKTMPKGQFIVMKTGTHPMRTRLKLFTQWGITFGQPLSLPDRAARPIHYGSTAALEQALLRAYPAFVPQPIPVQSAEGQEPHRRLRTRKGVESTEDEEC